MTRPDLDALEKLADEGLRLATGPYTEKGVYRHATIKALIAELKEARGLVEQSIDLMTDEYEDTKAHQQQARAFLVRNGKATRDATKAAS